MQTFGSNYIDGLHFLMADGSVHFNSEIINLTTYQTLGKREDGLPTGGLSQQHFSESSAILHVRSRLMMVLTVTTVAAIGCGESQPERFEIQGKVTFAGNPVPYGEIVFKPDGENDNPAPSAVGTIRNGAYQITADQGVIAGPNIVLISGFDGEIPGGASEDTDEGNAAKPLFENYRTEVDLKTEAGTQDFAVPAE